MPAPSDLVHETSTSTGTGNFTLSNANGKRSFNTAFGTGGTDVFDYFIMSRDAAEWERGTGHLSAASTLVRDTVIASSNSNNAVSFAAGTKDVTNDVPARKQAMFDTAVLSQFPSGYAAPINLGLAVSAGSSVLTIAIKGADGNDPSSTNPVYIPFRSATGGTGTPVWRTLTAASSIVISSGSTLGVTSSTAFRLWIVMFDDAGTLRPGVINCSTVTGSPPTAATIYPLAESSAGSSTAEGGAGAADSAGVFYTGSAVTSKMYRVLGYASWTASGLTAGTWTTTNLNYVQLYGPGVRLPGALVQSKMVTTGTATSRTANTYATTNLTVDITPTDAANLVQVFWSGNAEVDADNVSVNVALHRDGTRVMGGVGSLTRTSGSTIVYCFAAAAQGYLDKPNKATSTTYAAYLRNGNNVATVLFPSDGLNSETPLGVITVSELVG